MGYKGTPRTVKIEFAQGHEHHGAEARVRRMAFGEWEDIINSEDSNEVEELATRIVSWNLEDDDGKPIPATPEGLRQVDTSLVSALKNAWVQSITGVHDADPLPQSSPSGEPSLVESIPMEALSPSLAS